MSTVLSVESGGEVLSVALRIGSETRQMWSDAAPHSEVALPLVRKLLDEADLSLSQCDVFAFGAGPGKFSGLRLACGIAQMFAFATDRPGAPVNSLAALAEANYGDHETKAEAALPAHRGHIYAAKCRRTSCWQTSKPKLLTLEQYAPAKTTRNLCGAAFLQHPQLIAESSAATLSRVAPRPDASSVAKLAAAMLAEDKVLPPEKCAPQYIRTQIAQTAAERKAAKESKNK